MENSLRTLPPLIDFLGYVFFFGSILAGPFSEYKEYNDTIERRVPCDPPASLVWKKFTFALVVMIPAGLEGYVGFTWYCCDEGLVAFNQLPFWHR